MMDDDNPYEAPRNPPRAGFEAPGRRSKRADLKSVALYQKVILIWILVYIVAIVSQFALPEKLRPILLGVVALFGLVATAFIFMLAIKLYGVGLGILMGILTIVPCL